MMTPPEKPGPLAVVVFSGGMDSTVLATLYARHNYRLLLVTVDYGQRHVREIESARAIADHLNAEHIVIDARSIGAALAGSALTSPDVDVPEGHYAEDTMKATVVANRNAILANIAVGIAVARKATIVALGVHAGDHAVYPDCRPEFVDALSRLVDVANKGIHTPRVEAPFVHRTKADIAGIGARIDAPVHLSWSCYKGGTLHCGRCGTCVERREAHHDADVPDVTPYEDADYWRTAVAAS